MDQQTKQQLIEKSKELLSQARYLSAEEIFMIESALNAKEIPDNELQEIHDGLADYTNELDSAYADFKKEMLNALSEYTQKLATNKSSTQ